tara:strand:+ start:243 stop:632 length:390 start_codon:yes stop_codon:yes gene_type:complete
MKEINPKYKTSETFVKGVCVGIIGTIVTTGAIGEYLINKEISLTNPGDTKVRVINSNNDGAPDFFIIPKKGTPILYQSQQDGWNLKVGPANKDNLNVKKYSRRFSYQPTQVSDKYLQGTLMKKPTWRPR